MECPSSCKIKPLARTHPAYPLQRALREQGRVSRDVVGVWLLCHHADVSHGLRSSRLSREPWRSPIYRQTRPYLADSTLERTTEQWMLFNDPPKHTRLRRLVNGAFKPPVIAALRQRITAIAGAGRRTCAVWRPQRRVRRAQQQKVQGTERYGTLNRWSR